VRSMVRLIMFISLAGAVTNLYAGPSEKRFEGEWASHKDVDFSIHLHQDGNEGRKSYGHGARWRRPTFHYRHSQRRHRDR